LSDGKKILAVDAGNSRVKWALWHDGVFVAEDWCRTDDIGKLAGQWSSFDRPDRLVIANVAGEEVAEKLTQHGAALGLAPLWARGQKAQCGVTNMYDDPEQLGPDRWALLIGAHALVPGHCVVVGMGTATTINALAADGVFLGGMILPGFDLMHDLLSSRTARLGAERGELKTFPRSTPDAITSGAVRATCGAIEFMYQQMQSEGYRDVSILAAGGAASTFAGACKFPMMVREQLVLEGLVRIGLDMPQHPADQV